MSLSPPVSTLSLVALFVVTACGGGRSPAVPDAAADGDADADPAPDAGSDAVVDIDADEPIRTDGQAPVDAEEEGSPAGPLRVYVAPDGDDGRDGLSEAASVLTLERVHDILEVASPDRDVEVRIAPGRYQGQRVDWTWTMPDHSIRFMPLHDDEVRPVFDGCLVETPSDPSEDCPGGTWFRLRHSTGEETNLQFHSIRVERYGTAISLDGGRIDEADSNGSNTIYGCYFAEIGNVFNPALDPSTAAVRLVNSDDNEIANNHFVEVVNTRSGGLIHCIYNAHMSDRNRIVRNRFQSSTGDPVRIRDYSLDNVIEHNRFIQVGITAAYTEWYCDHEERTDCTKPEPECPSWGNLFRYNTIDGSWECAPLSTWHLAQDDETAGCSPPAPDARRLRTAGNEQTGEPCSLL